MGRDTLTGSRIRERRVLAGMKQAELARLAGVSASYLNLIEHNRRRIAGKLLIDIANILQVEPSLLTEGAEAALLAGLREAEAAYPQVVPDDETPEEFAGRFPGWARVMSNMVQRQTSLEQTVASLTDRMTHDPQLAEALHDMLGAVTAIRSTASILAETKEIEPEWRDRFHRNINEDARRLTEGSQALVSYLNADDASQSGGTTTPQDEIEAFYLHFGYYFAALEVEGRGGIESGSGAVADILGEAGQILKSASARAQVQAHLERYRSDADHLPLEDLTEALRRAGMDPAGLARMLGVPLSTVMRRLACLPGELITRLCPELSPGIEAEGLGLAICDSSGTFTFRKPISGFTLPRFGAACPLWTLYQALTHPSVPISDSCVQSGRDAAQFETYAVSEPVQAPRFGQVPLMTAHMLIVPTGRGTGRGTGRVAGATRKGSEKRPVGVSCRICARADCAGRREPSILSDGL